MDILRRPSVTLADRVRGWFQGPDFSQFAELLESDGSVAEYFGPNQAPKPRMIHILVQLRARRKWQDVNSRYRSANLVLLSLRLSYTPIPFHPITMSVHIIIVW